ncbi:MAG TPA: biotin--[acetyl-CoA-carboxylase] ligase [Vicinamibacterales bacterium]|nr:biotin--[acetyl-CoA-carboxylase] ligase [Vicinamibacterales bacterium]
MSLRSDIARALSTTPAERGVFGRSWEYFDEIGSTNDVALRAAERGAPEGSVFIAGAQTAGRGRLGRSWHSPPEAGLYVSTIVRRAPLAPWITLAGGVAVAQGIRESTGLPVQLKSPNDVVAVTGHAFQSRRKLAGILAEASSGADAIQYVVLGFGINLRPSAFPPDLAARVGSLEGELGRSVDGGAVLAACLAALHRVTAAVLASGPSQLLEEWLRLSPSAYGADVEWDGPDRVRTGVSAGIDGDGALRVATGGGVERIVSGEVRWK